MVNLIKLNAIKLPKTMQVCLQLFGLRHKKFFVTILCFLTAFCGIFLLTACGGDNDKVYDLIIESVEHGHVDIIATTDEYFYLKPVADEGYYFLKWDDYYNRIPYQGTNSGSDNYESIIQVRKSYSSPLSVKPVFTDDVDELIFFDGDPFKITGTNGLPVKIDYLPYSYKGFPQCAYFIYGNENLVLSQALDVFVTPGLFPDVVYNISDIRPLPFLGRSAIFLDDELPTEIDLTFIDMRDKCLIALNPIIENEENENWTIHGITEYRACNKGETTAVALSDYIMTFSDFQSSYVYAWENEKGEVISNDKYIEITPTKNMTFLAKLKKADEFFQNSNGECFSFSENEDHTLTLESLYCCNSFSITIPTQVNGKTVTGISNCIINSQNIRSLTIPETIVNFGDKAFAYSPANYASKTITILGERDNLEFSMFYGIQTSHSPNTYNFTQKTFENMVNNQVAKLVKNASLTIEFVDQTHLGTALGHYEDGTTKICVPKLEEGNLYTSNFLYTIAHELRHFYQCVAIDGVEGLSVDDLAVPATDNQIGAWKYLDYTSSTEDYNKYWYNAREIDAREYAYNVLGFDLI